MALLCCDDKDTATLLEFFLDLFRYQQQRGETMHMLWDTVVAQNVNDEAIHVALGLRRRVNGDMFSEKN